VDLHSGGVDLRLGASTRAAAAATWIWGWERWRGSGSVRRRRGAGGVAEIWGGGEALGRGRDSARRR